MWTSVFVFLAIGGSAVARNFGKVFDNCETSKCENNPFSGIELKGLPNEEQLKVICGKVLEQQECEKNAIEECEGKDLEELSASENTSVAFESTRLLNLYGLKIDICDENSRLHEGYVSSVECFNNLTTEKPTECDAKSVYRAYVQSQDLLGVRISARDSQCLMMAYTVACFSVELKEQCGELARVTMVEIVKRVQFLTNFPTFFGPFFCTKDQVEKLKTSFLDFMELDEQRKSMFYQVFDAAK